MKNPYPRTKLTSLLTVTILALAPVALAVDPPPDGGYPNFNTAEGDNALFSLTTGAVNTAIGIQALYSDTAGSNNTANGGSALLSNTIGNNNTANGVDALYSNTTGNDNTATGLQALFSNTIGGVNTAAGYQALFSNTTGTVNTATGWRALYSNTTGENNTANGTRALLANTVGILNTATGADALTSNTTGSSNTAIGDDALDLNTTGSSNIALGYQAGRKLRAGGNNIYIGNIGGKINESGAIRIGTNGTHQSSFIAGISGVAVASGVGVMINSDGQLGTVVSSQRFKDAIKPMDKASEAILALKPVTFRYKHELDPDGIPQFGLVAEQVEKVDPDLVARDEQGKAYTVRYEAVNAMLLNEFLKEHRKVEDLEATVAKLQSVVQKVSNQIELTKPAPQVANK